MKHRVSRDPLVEIIIICLVLIVIGIPVGLAFWNMRAVLYLVGYVIIGLFLFAGLFVVVALAGWALSKWDRTVTPIPSTQEGMYVARGRRIIPLKPLQIEAKRYSGEPVTHIPVHVEYVGENASLKPDIIEDWADIDQRTPLPSLDDLYKGEGVDTEDYDTLGYETTETTKQDEHWYGLCKTSYLQGFKSRAALSQAVGCTEHYIRSRKVIERIKEDLKNEHAE